MITTSQRDAYQRTLDAQVLACEPADANRSSDSPVRFRIRVADSVLYPEGGGQPADTGQIGDARVLDVTLDDAGAIWLFTDAAVSEGEARQTLDWPRRWDHMQQHTGQHLLTAVADDAFGWPTVAFHLGSEMCTVDLAGADLDADGLVALEDRVNAHVREARPVAWRTVDRATYDRLDGVRSRGLPAGHTGDVRLVEIEGLDLNTCGGTHVANLSELQLVALVGAECVNGGTRVSYLAGDRARRYLRRCQARERTLNHALSTGPHDHLAAVERLLDEQRRARQTERRLVDSLAEADAVGLASSANGSSGGVATLHREGVDMGFLRRVASQTLSLAPDALLVLTASEPGDVAGVFLIAGPADTVTRVGPGFAAAVAGRGGGRGERFQGKAARLDRRADAMAELLG